MARIPEGATLIGNPVSTAPGFTIENVHVMAGVPSVFNAMVQSVIPTLTGGAPMLSETWRVQRGEGDLAEPLALIAAEFTDLSVGSYPFQKDGRYGSNIVIRGQDAARLDVAMAKLKDIFPA
jgi:molybdopterin-biosynthesis enzyme MoeA-like protein